MQVEDLKFHTGDKISGVVCQTKSDRITNGDDKGDADDTNPGLATPERWYGVRLTTKRLAYFSEMWAAPSDRGGLRLPRCS